MAGSIDHLRRTIKTYMSTEHMEEGVILNVMKRCIDAKDTVFVILNPETNSIVMITDEDEHILLPLFFSVDAMEKFDLDMEGRRPATGMLRLSDLASILDRHDDLDGIVFEPKTLDMIMPADVLSRAADSELAPELILVIGDAIKLSGSALVCPTNRKFSGKSSLEQKLRSFTDGEDSGNAGDNLNTGDICVCEVPEPGMIGFGYDYILYSSFPDASDALLLGRCYKTVLDCAKDLGLSSVVFPCDASDLNGVDPDTARETSVREIINWFNNNSKCTMDVYLCCPDEKTWHKYLEHFKSLS